MASWIQRTVAPQGASAVFKAPSQMQRTVTPSAVKEANDPTEEGTSNNATEADGGTNDKGGATEYEGGATGDEATGTDESGNEAVGAEDEAADEGEEIDEICDPKMVRQRKSYPLKKLINYQLDSTNMMFMAVLFYLLVLFCVFLYAQMVYQRFGKFTIIFNGSKLANFLFFSVCICFAVPLIVTMYNLSVIRELRVAPLHNIPSRPVLISNIMGGVSVLLIMLAVIVLSATTTQWRSIIKANLEKAIPNGTKEVSVIQFYFGCCGRGEDVPTEAWKSLVFQRGNLYSNSMSHPNYLPWSCCNIANEGLCHNIGWERYAIKYTESTWNTEHGPNRTLKVDEHGVGADFKKMVSWQEEGVHSVYAGENCEQAVFWGMVKEVFIPVPILFFIMAFFSAATTILIFNSAKFIREDSEKSFPQRKGPKDGESGKSDGSKGACTEDGVKKEDGDKKKEGDKQLTSRIHALSAKPTASQMQASSAKPLASRMEASSAKPAASRMQASSATKVASRIHALSAKPTASQMQASSAKPLASRMEASSAKPAASRMQASTATKVASQMQVSRANQGASRMQASSATKVASRMQPFTTLISNVTVNEKQE